MNKLLKPYIAITEFLGVALGDNVEIALHDLTSSKQEVIAIANNNSGREIGAGLSNLSLRYLEEKKYLDKDYVVNYKSIGHDGRLMKSANFFIRDEAQEEPIGMLCVNVNLSDYEYLTSTIKKILGIQDEDSNVEFKLDNPVEILASPIEDMISQSITECLELLGFPKYYDLSRLNVEEKIKIVKFLNDKGTFSVKGAVSIVATTIHVSEQTIYRYLKKV